MVKTQLQVQPVFRCRLTSISLFCFYLSLSSSVDESLCVDEYGGLSCGHRHSIVFQRPLPGSNPGCCCVRCPNFQSSAEISQEQVCSGHKIARSCHVNAVTSCVFQTSCLHFSISWLINFSLGWNTLKHQHSLGFCTSLFYISQEAFFCTCIAALFAIAVLV